MQNLVCHDDHEKNCGPHEYSVVQGKFLRFSFREGIVALAYTRQMVDPETGYPMIPDEISAITAITKYITMKLMERDYYAGRDGSQGRLQKAESDWQWYCKQAANQHFGLHGIDDFQDMLEQRQHMIPNLNHYYSFFGNLNKGEGRKWNDPDGRNSSFRIING